MFVRHSSNYMCCGRTRQKNEYGDQENFKAGSGEALVTRKPDQYQ